MVTIFRSADPTAADDAAGVREVLASAGLHPEVLDDSAPGVPPGSVEVCVPEEEEKQAEAALAAARRAEEAAAAEPKDDSPDLDLVTVFEGVGANAELEAMSVHAVLESNGLPSVVVGPPQIPNLPFMVQVPRNHYEEAVQALAEAEAAGPSAAEEAEQASEG